MGIQEKRLIEKATRKHKKIFPCAHKDDISQCFTLDDGRLMLWFNTEDQSTHVVSAVVKKSRKKVS
jgi:hypothetical protein